MIAHRRLPLDPARRHLVLGDLHGRHATLAALLERVGHDPARDVVYAVGDLIDRGPDAVAVVERFGRERWHAVRGNHEQMILNPARWREVWERPRNGGRATRAALARHGRDLDWLAAFCRTLPVCLDVGEEGAPGAFRLIHAESPFDWPEERLVRTLARTGPGEPGESRLLWGRSDVERVLEAPADADGRRRVEVHPGRSTRRVFCGHTSLPDVVGAAGTHWIDTFAGGFMTCVEALTMTVHREPLAPSDRR